MHVTSASNADGKKRQFVLVDKGNLVKWIYNSLAPRLFKRLRLHAKMTCTRCLLLHQSSTMRCALYPSKCHMTVCCYWCRWQCLGLETWSELHCASEWLYMTLSLICSFALLLQSAEGPLWWTVKAEIVSNGEKCWLHLRGLEKHWL